MRGKDLRDLRDCDYPTVLPRLLCTSPHRRRRGAAPAPALLRTPDVTPFSCHRWRKPKSSCRTRKRGSRWKSGRVVRRTKDLHGWC